MTSTTRPMTVPQLAPRLIRTFTNHLPSLVFLTACLRALPSMAQPANQAPTPRVSNDKMVLIEIPAQPDAIELDTGSLPGATVPESWHTQYGSKFARNVTVATLRPFLPDPSKASGAAVIVAPGGAPLPLSFLRIGKPLRCAPYPRNMIARLGAGLD
jgi:hypothetical protein